MSAHHNSFDLQKHGPLDRGLDSCDRPTQRLSVNKQRQLDLTEHGTGPALKLQQQRTQLSEIHFWY